MPQPTSSSKPRFTLFSVGRNKASPARVASSKRASLRLSAIRTEALKLPAFDFAESARPDSGDARWEQNGRSSAAVDTPSEDVSEIPVPDMKDTALPPLPQDAAPQAHASASVPRPRPAERLPAPATAVDARIPPPPPKSGPSRLPPQSAPMPPSRTQTQAPPGSNIFRRITSKLRSSSTPHPSADPSTSAKRPQDAPTRKRSALRMPAMPKAPVPAAPPNDFTSREQRQAALRARGLLPPVASAYRDANGFMVPLSEQEAELDRRYTVVVEESEGSEQGAEASEAKKIREAWLARNKDAGTPARGSLEVTGEDDAARRASVDGKIGDRSPVQPTFVAASVSTENARASQAMVEDFRVVPAAEAAGVRDTPPHDPPGSPSSHSSAVTEKVSRWLRSSTDAPTPLSVSTEPSTVETTFTESPRTSPVSDARDDASPAGTVRAKQRKEKPPPIVVTAQRPSNELTAKAKSKAPAPAITVAVAALSDSEASASDEHSALAPRGRQASQGRGRGQPQPPLLTHTSSSSSRGTTVPALSPTRTISSSGAESTLPTPTTTSCQRDVSISRGSTSHSSEQSHSAPRGRRGSAPAAQDAQPSMKTKASMKGGLIQSSIEETDSSEEGEFGQNVSFQPAPATVPAARPRPQKQQTAEQAAEAQVNRKSFSLFGKKSLDSATSTTARTSSSMSNLRRAFSGGLKPRPHSQFDPSASQHKRTKMFDASRLPASPPTAFPAVAVPLQGRTTGVGLRPRQALAPTMHSRGSILQQAHFIEDDESRRLSEMAFLT